MFFCKEFTLQQEKYMIEGQDAGIVTTPKRISDADGTFIFILFHSGSFRYFKHYYKEYMCRHLFPYLVFYNRFVELEKEVLFP